ncbi:major facilitator superfamily domain-containing protein [Aspergillus unguis]
MDQMEIESAVGGLERSPAVEGEVEGPSPQANLQAPDTLERRDSINNGDGNENSTSRVPADIQIQDPENQHQGNRSKRQTAATLTALYLVMFTTALDQTITATSIPSISSSLHSAAGYTWIGSAYLLATAATGPIWVRLSDIFGRKPALLGSVGAFALGSILAATAGSMRMLIAARGVQGCGAGGVAQLVYVTIADLFSVRERALWYGLLGGVWAVAGSAGPVVGGALTEGVGWRWCFWINVPVCGLALVLLVVCLDVYNPRTGVRDGLLAVDWAGTVLVVGVTLLLLLGMEFGVLVPGWDSPTVVCMLVFGVVCVGVFVLVEGRVARYPLVPLRLFKEGSVNAVFVLAFAHGMVSLGVEYYLPLYFQSVKQVNPLQSGLFILPMMVIEAGTDIVSGIILHRIGRYREITWVGVVLMCLGTGLFITLDREASLAKIIGFEIVGGIGIALLFQTPAIAIQSSVRRGDTAAAIATSGFLRNLATSFSIVLGGVVFRNGMERQQGFLLEQGLDRDVVRKLAGDMAAASVGIVKDIQDPKQREAVQDAFAWSLRNMFIFYTAVAGVAVVANVFVKQREMSTTHTEVKTGLEGLKSGN